MADVANSTTLSEKTISFPTLDTQGMTANQYAVILETLSAMGTLVLGIVNQPRCNKHDNGYTHIYNNAGEYLDDLLTSIEDAKTATAEALKIYQPKNEDEIERRAYALIRHIAEDQELSPLELAQYAIALSQAQH